MSTVARVNRLVRAEVEEAHRLNDARLSQRMIAERLNRAPSTVAKALRLEPARVPVHPQLRIVGHPEMSLKSRKGTAAVRRGLASGELTLADVLLPVDDRIARALLADVVRMQWVSGRGASVERIGREAVGAGVNLLIASGRASVYSRAWIVEHAQRGAGRRTRQ